MSAQFPKGKNHDFFVLGSGLVAMSICTSLPIKKAEFRANQENPTGISSRWSKSADEHFAQGPEFPNGMACPELPGHRHWLLEC
jgi:hypothetical protein